jgi:hypothetical protein
LLLGQREHEGFLFAEGGQHEAGRLAFPFVAVGDAAFVAVDAEFVAQGFEQALDAAFVALKTFGGQGFAQFAAVDFAPARDAPQQGQGQQRGFHGFGFGLGAGHGGWAVNKAVTKYHL